MIDRVFPWPICFRANQFLSHAKDAWGENHVCVQIIVNCADDIDDFTVIGLSSMYLTLYTTIEVCN